MNRCIKDQKLSKKYSTLFKNITGKEITPADRLPKSAKVPLTFQNRVAFFLDYIRKASAISHLILFWLSCLVPVVFLLTWLSNHLSEMRRVHKIEYLCGFIFIVSPPHILYDILDILINFQNLCGGLRQISGILHVLRSPPPIKLSVTI